MKNIKLFLTGGTIACPPSENGLAPIICSAYPELNVFFKNIKNTENINISVEELFSIDSTLMTPAHCQLMARAVFSARMADQNIDGFVIAHGTDTLQYTSAALSFMLRNFDRPVILTGSQIPMFDPKSDAAFNMRCAFLAAQNISHGVFVVFNGKIIHGSSAVKVHSRDVDAFVDADGNVGFFDMVGNDKINLKMIKKIPKLDRGFKPELRDRICEDVFLLKITPNLKPEFIDYIEKVGYRGIVCEAYGLGGIPTEIAEKLGNYKKNNKKVRIIVTSSGFGGVDLNVYEVGRRLLKLGLESGGTLTASGAFVKLMCELEYE